MQKIKKIIKYVIGSLILAPVTALAQAGGTGLQYPPQPNGLPNAGGGTATTLLLYVINIALAVAGIISVLFLIYGGFRYITSAGNDEAAGEGKKIIQNSIIGLIIIILSYTIIHVIISAVAFQIT